ncbi:YciI family protein [Thermomonas alba]|uniref:YciI family protein n=1 Tax=Thermomonas alba TaxID=2888525 RepID=UPI001F042D5E|nr:YciI family protein [Thermomonas alba]
MWYAIEGFDGQDVLPQRQQARPAHLARLHALRDAGRLLLAGPCPAIDAEDPGPAGFSGSIVIAEFDSLEEARAWAEADPYVAAGVYARVEVRPFRKVLP